MLARLGLESWQLSKLRVALALALARAYALPTSLSRHPSGRAFAFPNLAGDGRVPSRCYLWVSAFLTMNEFNFFSSYSLFSIPSTLVLYVLEKRLQPLRATRFSIRGPSTCSSHFIVQSLQRAFPLNLNIVNMNSSSRNTSSIPRQRLAGILHQTNKSGELVTSEW